MVTGLGRVAAMCGIAGVVSHKGVLGRPLLDGLQSASLAMVTRGPDGSGHWESRCHRVALAHRRLAILDLSPAGAQPMRSRCGRFTVVFNGEIYNAPQLRSENAGTLGDLRGTSDTEVLLELFALKGPALFRELRGMFAAAIWDERDQQLTLVRDPFGIKPLYVVQGEGLFAFASQVKSLLAGGFASRDLDPESVLAFRVWGHVPEPSTLFREISAFPPGAWGRVSPGGDLELESYCSVAELLSSGSASDSTLELRPTVLDSVRQHLLSDVPVGVFLSAGIDSTTLASLASEVGGEVRTVTLGFEQYRGTPDDEVPLAEQVATQLGANHTTVWLTAADFEGALGDFVGAMDQPTLDGLNTWLVARAAAEAGLTVALSGLGGDELFMGYDSFRQVPRIRALASLVPGGQWLGAGLRLAVSPLVSRLTSPKYAGLLEYGGSWEGAYLLRRGLRMPWEVRAGRGREAQGSLLGDGPPQGFEGARAVSWLEATRYMRNQLLRDSDWAGMAHSLEIRVPLVDPEVARLVARAHDHGHPLTKQDLAATARPTLPSDVVERPKTGFTVPVRDWLVAGSHRADLEARGLRGWSDLVLDLYLESLP